MTLAVAFEKGDKIAIMADTRTTYKTDGETQRFIDTTLKVQPIKDIVLTIIGASGIRAQDEFSNIAEAIAANYETIEIQSFLNELSATINKLLSLTNYQGNMRFSLLACQWKDGESMIYEYSSTRGTIVGPFYLAVNGSGQELMVREYVNPAEFERWSYEELIERCKQGFERVLNTYDSVGGELTIYELNKKSKLSKWLVAPSWL